jgi:hypothetical protein
MMDTSNESDAKDCDDGYDYKTFHGDDDDDDDDDLGHKSRGAMNVDHQTSRRHETNQTTDKFTRRAVTNRLVEGEANGIENTDLVSSMPGAAPSRNHRNVLTTTENSLPFHLPP